MKKLVIVTGRDYDFKTNYDYFGAGDYDGRIGRWLSVDQLAVTCSEWSPYHHCKNDPLKLIDPTEMKDTTFIAGKDDNINPMPGTETPIFICDANGLYWRRSYFN